VHAILLAIFDKNKFHNFKEIRNPMVVVVVV
jgi:hypothetical protein